MSLIQDASLAMIPSGYSNGTLHSLLPEVKTLSQELVTNGGFDTDTAWTKGAGWSIDVATGTAKSIGSNNYSGLRQSPNFTYGKLYSITYTISNYVSGVLRLVLGNTGGAYRSSNGTFTEYLNYYEPNATGETIAFYPWPNFVGSIDNVSVKEIDRLSGDFTFSRGSNLAATRVNADGLIEKGRENIILYSEDFDNEDNWDRTYVGVNTNSITSPDESNNADKITASGVDFSHFISQSKALSNDTIYCASIYAKSSEEETFFFRQQIKNGSYVGAKFNLTNGTITSASGLISSKAINVGNGWYRCEIVFNSSSGATSPRTMIYLRDAISYLGDNSSGIYVWGAQLELGSVATDYIPTNGSTGKAGVLENTPRLNYEGSCPYLLLEPARTNEFPYSENSNSLGLVGFSVGTASYTITNNYAISPDGNQSAIRFQGTIGSTINDRCGLRDTLVATLTTSTFSFYGKSNNGSNQNIAFHFLGGIQDVVTLTNEWQRFTYTRLVDDASLNVGVEFRGTYTTPLDFDVLLWGFQFEEGSYATSYIPTYGTIQTRSGDVCTGAGDSSVFNDSEGVLFAEVAALTNDNVYRAFSLRGANANDRVVLSFMNTASHQLRSFVVSGGTPNFLPDHTLSNSVIFNKMALKYKTNDFALWVNGAEAKTDTSGNAPIGLKSVEFNNGASGDIFYGKVKSLIYFPTALTDDELQALTSSNINEVLRTYQGRLSFIDATYEGGLVDSNLTNLF